MKTMTSLNALYSSASPAFGLVPSSKGFWGIPTLALLRWCGVKKTLCGSCGRPVRSFYDRRIHRVRDQDSGGTRIYLEFEYRRVECRRCQVNPGAKNRP